MHSIPAIITQRTHVPKVCCLIPKRITNRSSYASNATAISSFKATELTVEIPSTKTLSPTGAMFASSRAAGQKAGATQGKRAGVAKPQYNDVKLATSIAPDRKVAWEKYLQEVIRTGQRIAELNDAVPDLRGTTSSRFP